MNAGKRAVMVGARVLASIGATSPGVSGGASVCYHPRMVRRGWRSRGLAALAALAVMLGSASARADGDPDPWFGADKAWHFGAGLGLSAVGYGVGIAAFDDRWAALGLGGGVALGLGAAKEAVDAAGLGVPSERDFVWTAVGAALGLGLSVTFDAALRGPGP